MSLARYETFVDNIASGLTRVDPVHALAYLDNAADYKRSGAPGRRTGSGVCKGPFSLSLYVSGGGLGPPVLKSLIWTGSGERGGHIHIIDLMTEKIHLLVRSVTADPLQTIPGHGAPSVWDTLTEGDYAVDSYLTSPFKFKKR